MTFIERMTVLGLRLPPEEAAKLEVMVADLDRSAARLRGERSYAQEPLSGFRLRAATPLDGLRIP